MKKQLLFLIGIILLFSFAATATEKYVAGYSFVEQSKISP